MCGIAGMIDWRAATPADTLRATCEAMIETVRHRGPDAGEVWVEAAGGVALGQRRLAIIDLSPGGAQPMHSADRRYVITFNGEIYNYREIRRELQASGHFTRGESDTEVLLEACALWGVEVAIERSASADVDARQSIMPAMPNIALPRTVVAVYPVNILWLFAQTDVGDVVSTEAHITASELWHAANPARLYPTDACNVLTASSNV